MEELSPSSQGAQRLLDALAPYLPPDRSRRYRVTDVIQVVRGLHRHGWEQVEINVQDRSVYFQRGRKRATIYLYGLRVWISFAMMPREETLARAVRLLAIETMGLVAVEQRRQEAMETIQRRRRNIRSSGSRRKRTQSNRPRRLG